MKTPKLLLCLAALALTAGAQNQRTLCLFFDLNSLNAADQAKAQASAIQYVQEQLTAQDRVTVMTYGAELKVVQDASSDREALLAALRGIMPDSDNVVASDVNGRLQAIEKATMILEPVAGKKAIILFSAGIHQNDLVDSDQLKATVNAAKLANLAIYSVDARGLGNAALPR